QTCCVAGSKLTGESAGSKKVSHAPPVVPWPVYWIVVEVDTTTSGDWADDTENLLGCCGESCFACVSDGGFSAGFVSDGAVVSGGAVVADVSCDVASCVPALGVSAANAGTSAPNARIVAIMPKIRPIPNRRRERVERRRPWR